MQTRVEVSAAAAPQAPPAPPAPPAPVPTGILIEGVPGVAGQTLSVPMTAEDVAWLRDRRAELSDHLTRANNRRDIVTGELDGARGANREGLDARLRVLDERIGQLESEIAHTERLLTGAPTAFLAAAKDNSSGEQMDDGAVVIGALLTVFVFFPLALAFARRLWKRTPAPRAIPAAEAGRLERMEQAIEAIAVEVERVSEGQRFVTKLLSDTSRATVTLPQER